MAMVVVCQHCGQRYSVREDLLGKALAQCLGLKQLKLTDCFNIAGVTPLSNLPNLRLLNLSNTKVTDTSSLSKNANLKITFEEEEDDGEEEDNRSF